jgi:hypothetical protein
MKLAEIRSQFESDLSFLTKIKEKVQTLAVENPDFIYNSNSIGQCYYNRGPEGGKESKGCIFGQALQNMGWNDSDELESRDSIAYILDVDANVKGCVSKTENSIYLNILSEVQTNQDHGKSWQEAIEPLNRWSN